MNVMAYARKILDAAPRPLPRYGSPEWESLEESDPRRLAAVVVAAECWRDHCSTERVAEDMSTAITAEAQLRAQAMREASGSVHAHLPRAGST